MARDYKKEYKEYHSKPEQKKRRAMRNKANRNSDTKPGQEVDHKVPLSRGGSNDPSNWRVVSRDTNRSKKDKLAEAIVDRAPAEQDVYVQSAVPTKYIDLVKRKGLASQKAIAEDPELLKAFLDIRGLSEDQFRSELAEKLDHWHADAVSGPSVFFTSPDPDKVSDPRHFINKFETSPVKINLSRLIKDIPDTRIAGSELVPYDPEGPEHQGDIRHRDITLEQAAEYARTDPKELWKNYKPEYVGKYYAADVPHAQIVTPSGVIPPEYLEVEKAPEEVPDLNKWIKSIEEEARRRGVRDMHVVMSHPKHPLGGGSAHYTTDLDKDSKSALLVKALRGKMREWEKSQGLDPDHDWSKTSSARRHRAALIVRDPETGKVLVRKGEPDNPYGPYTFPGGGIYEEEIASEAMPSSEQVLEGAQREALEELGYGLANPSIVYDYGEDFGKEIQDRLRARRGVPYTGGHEHYILADKGKEDMSLYNVEGDAFVGGTYEDPQEVYDAFVAFDKSNPGNLGFNKSRAEALRRAILEKTSSVANLKYTTEVAKRFQPYIKQERKVIKIPIEYLPKPAPPRNESQKTRDELLTVKYHMDNPVLDEETMIICDREPEELFYRECKRLGISQHKREAKKVYEDFNKIAFDLKYIFLRPRPWSLAEYHGVNLNVMPPPSADTPSYPSGHAMMGYGLQAFYSRKYPEHTKIWEKLGHTVQHSRLQAGLHFPSDNAYSKQIVDFIMSREKIASADYRPRGTLFLTDDKGRVFAGKTDMSKPGAEATSPYYFPGGGILKEEGANRVPTRKEIAEGIRTEALEELGIGLEDLKVLTAKGNRMDMPEWWRERQFRKRGVGYKGLSEYYATARAGAKDDSLYNVEGDAFDGDYYPIEEVATALEARAARGDDPYAQANKQQAKLIRALLEKNSMYIPNVAQARAGLTMARQSLGGLFSRGGKQVAQAEQVAAKVTPTAVAQVEQTAAKVAPQQVVQGTQQTTQQVAKQPYGNIIADPYGNYFFNPTVYGAVAGGVGGAMQADEDRFKAMLMGAGLGAVVGRAGAAKGSQFAKSLMQRAQGAVAPTEAAAAAGGGFLSRLNPANLVRKGVSSGRASVAKKIDPNSALAEFGQRYAGKALGTAAAFGAGSTLGRVGFERDNNSAMTNELLAAILASQREGAPSSTGTVIKIGSSLEDAITKRAAMEKTSKAKKPKGTATKRDPKKWAAAKARAKAKMGGKWSARAAQLAVKYYKDSGGRYKGKKPTAKNNKLKKWTKQDWQWSGERKKKSSLLEAILEKEAKEKKKKGKGVYLPAKSIDALKSSKKGRNKLKNAINKKNKATREGKQHADHGLHRGKNRSKLGD